MGEQINIGIAGSVTRGRAFRMALESIGTLKVHAVCETNREKLEESRVI